MPKNQKVQEEEKLEKIEGFIDEDDLSSDSDNPEKDDYGKKFGKMKKDVNNRKRFAVKISYNKDDVPTLNIIPSKWRYPTAVNSNNNDNSKEGKDLQGDHVIAYNLILNCISVCKGQNIQTLPEKLYRIFSAILPEKESEFRKMLKQNNNDLQKLRRDRKNTTAALRKKSLDSQNIKKSLKKLEINKIGSCVEELANKFIEYINFLENESFHQDRKKDSVKMVKDAIKNKLEAEEKENDQYSEFYSNLKESFLRRVAKSITDDVLGEVADDIIKPFKENVRNILKDVKESVKEDEYDDKYGELKYNNKKGRSFKETQITKVTNNIKKELIKSVPPKFRKDKGIDIHKGKVKEYLKSITPLKKQSEEKGVRLLKSDNWKDIAKGAFKLFDYPRVLNEELNNLEILCEAISRHMVLIFNSFENLQDLSKDNKIKIFDKFLDDILDLQLWNQHKINNKILDKETLKLKTKEFANLDFNKNNFFMFSKEQKIALQKIKFVELLSKAYSAKESNEESKKLINQLESNKNLQKLLKDTFSAGDCNFVLNKGHSNKARVKRLDKLEDEVEVEEISKYVGDYLFNSSFYNIKSSDINIVINQFNYDDEAKEDIKIQTIKQINQKIKEFNKDITPDSPIFSVSSPKARSMGSINSLSFSL